MTWENQLKYQRALELHPDYHKKQWNRQLELHGREYIRKYNKMMYFFRKIKKLNKTESVIG